MAFLTVGKENSADIQLYYEDRGSGPPVVLIHGWPLSGGSWEKQSHALLAAGYRVITYDRRGFGRSSAPSVGYNYDTLATDLATLVDKLGLRDMTLAGFSMGGGEVARYMGKFGGKHVARIALVASIAPALGKDGNNPDGVDRAVFEGIKDAIRNDRYAFLSQFLDGFYNKGKTSISDQAIEASWSVAASSSYGAMLTCVDSWLEDFRADLAKVTVPTLVLHGDSDAIVPFEASGKRVPEHVKHAQVHVIKNGPHGCNWTHAEETNRILLGFLK